MVWPDGQIMSRNPHLHIKVGTAERLWLAVLTQWTN